MSPEAAVLVSVVGTAACGIGWLAIRRRAHGLSDLWNRATLALAMMTACGPATVFSSILRSRTGEPVTPAVWSAMSATGIALVGLVAWRDLQARVAGDEDTGGTADYAVTIGIVMAVLVPLMVGMALVRWYVS